MATDKIKIYKGTTPKGTFKYPRLTEPDYGSKDYPDPDGSYKLTLVMSQAQAQKFIDQLQPEFDKAIELGQEAFAKLPVANRKKLGEIKTQDFYSEVYDKESEEPTGEIEFKFKCKAGGTTKAGKPWSRTVALFDAKGNPAKNIKEIWGGTEGKVSFTTSPYFVAATGTAGLSLRLEAVQILKLVVGGSRDAAGYGFGKEDGDFDATEETQGFVDETDSDDPVDACEDF